MKKQIRQILMFSASLMSNIIILGIFCTNSTFAQTEPPNANKSDVWEVDYMVTVRGKFQVKPELGSGDPDVFYKIDRTYEGKSRLVYLKSNSEGLLFENLTDVIIHIDDTREEIGDPTCDEYLTVHERWSGDMSTSKGNPKYLPSAQLIIDNRKRNYLTFFQLFYAPNKNQNDILYRKVSMIHSKGGETKMVDFPLIKKLRYDDYGKLPKVKGYISNADAIVHTRDWSELKKRDDLSPNSQILTLDMRVDTRDRLVWVSEALHPDEPLIPGVSESKDKVTVFIKYALKRVKG
jgi:hypothetical protein